MKVKTYKYESLQEGLEHIKRDLGNDALILSTRSVSIRPRFRLFKRQAWEITVAVEEETRTGSNTRGREPEIQIPERKTTSTLVPFPVREKGSSSETTPAPAAATAVAPARDQRMDALIDEIAELKKSFRNLSKAMPGRTEGAGGLFAELIGHGIDHDLADQLITGAAQGNAAPSELRDRVRSAIADHILIAPPAEFHAKTRMVTAFVGPAGVGKTTTIAKIAGHASIRMNKKVALISTDMVRIGGQEQLIRFGELLGIPTYGCADVTTLKDLVASLDDRDLILIDTHGSSPSDLSRLSRLEAVTSAADAKVHLVISATTRSEDISKIIVRFQRLKPNTVIFTKIDETDSKGPLTGDLLRNEVPVSYMTNGQRVPEDLVTPNPDELARYVLPVEPEI
jgi:flagellar biosynthesis protein FlhF